jgi:hypothetical protein
MRFRSSHILFGGQKKVGAAGLLEEVNNGGGVGMNRPEKQTKFTWVLGVVGYKCVSPLLAFNCNLPCELTFGIFWGIWCLGWIKEIEKEALPVLREGKKGKEIVGVEGQRTWISFASRHPACRAPSFGVLFSEP